MSMTVAQAENLTFAVGAARFASPAEALAAIEPMKHALVKNIGGKIIMEKAVDGKAGDRITAIDVEAVGASNAALQPARRLGARFVVKDDRAYQVVIVAPGELPTETVDTFLTSFKPE
ncbi:MAG: hypothetical protein K0S28_200 [Paucimonas sp.]|nr:hypothetical protein [Paucimonas sp.]